MTHTYGPTYDEQLDGRRISDQHARIRGYMLTVTRRGGWQTLAEIRAALGYPEASISAQLRHLRKSRFGAYRVEKRRRQPDGGTWEYQVRQPVEVLQLEG